VKRKKLPFNKNGGVIVIGLTMLKSKAYLSLPAASRSLLIQLQTHWRNDKAVDYGIRQAIETVPCSFGTARKAFNDLMDKGFIVCTEYSEFNSRTTSKTRSWRLTWLPFEDKKPTDDWKRWGIN